MSVISRSRSATDVFGLFRVKDRGRAGPVINLYIRVYFADRGRQQMSRSLDWFSSKESDRVIVDILIFQRRSKFVNRWLVDWRIGSSIYLRIVAVATEISGTFSTMSFICVVRGNIQKFSTLSKIGQTKRHYRLNFIDYYSRRDYCLRAS